MAKSFLLLLCAALAPLCVYARRPDNAVNITVIGLRPSNLSSSLDNKDTADAAGDLFYYVGDRMPQPMQCRKQPWYPLCKDRKIVAHDGVYTQYLLEVDSTFGGCPSGDASCTKYGICEPVDSDPSGATWSCKPQLPYVGIANVSQRYPRAQGKKPWDLWKFQASKFIGGLWYSTQQGGNCDEPSAAACKWRIVHTLKTINATCANGNVHAAVEARNPKCFDACSPADKQNPESDCFINCFFDTLFDGGMSVDDILQPFEAAFTSDDPAKQGCPALPPR